MILLIPVLLLLITPLAMLALHLLRPRFSYFWLVAAGAGLLAWPMVLLARLQMPFELSLATWRPQELFSTSPTLLLDAISWPFALALVTLILSAILTDAARTSAENGLAPDWKSWANSLAITGLGLLSVLSANLLTALLALTAMDLVEMVIWLSQAHDNAGRERAIIAWSARLAGIVGVILAGMVASASNLPSRLDAIPAQVGVYLILAAGLRLGMLSASAPMTGEIPLPRSLSTILRLAPNAANLALLARAARAGAPSSWSPYLLVLAGVLAISSSLAWLKAKNELQGQVAWVTGMAGLALASAVRGELAASLAWGVGLLMAGGLLFLFSPRHRRLSPLPMLGALGLSALPFTPGWPGVRLVNAATLPLSLIFLIPSAMLLAGFIRHTLRGEQPPSGERWTWAIYAWGLILLLLAYFAIGWLNRSEAITTAGGAAPPTWLESWPALASSLLAVLIIAWQRRRVTSRKTPGLAKPTFSMDWLTRWGRGIYQALIRLFWLVSRTLEGRAGVLWALLLLILLISLLAQARSGG